MNTGQEVGPGYPKGHPSRLAATFYKAYSALGFDELMWMLGPKQLRILMYHGICPDELANEPWMPPSFVRLSDFNQQMEYLTQHCKVMPLGAAFDAYQKQTLPKQSAVITFDDGYYNNLELAYPVLKKYGLPATIFLSTSYVENGGLFPPDRFRILALHAPAKSHGKDGAFGYTHNNLDTVLRATHKLWTEMSSGLTAEQRRCLRALSIEELSQLHPGIVNLEPHSDEHRILSNESRVQRRGEITRSIQKLREWTGKSPRFFAYPNGQLKDFGTYDKVVLHQNGVQAAVTSVPGLNAAGTDPYELKRFCVGLYHRPYTFASEVTGFRTLVRNMAPWHERRGSANDGGEITIEDAEQQELTTTANH